MFFLLSRAFKRKTEEVGARDGNVEISGTELKKKVDSVFARSLFVRVVDTGSCNACEVEIANLNNPYYDIERFGVKFVASPKHADVVMATGCLTRNMLVPLKKAYGNTPSPKFVVTVGDCARDGGPFRGSYQVEGPVSKHLPVHIHVHGCPPEAADILGGLLKLMDLIGKAEKT